MSLHGLPPGRPRARRSTHVSYYEADAFARWAGKRLPTEFEWEVAAASCPSTAATLGAGHLRPMPARAGAPACKQMFGDVWEWTASAYLPYPGFKAAPGAVGEYNGKFMCNQFVLQRRLLRDAGGPCAREPIAISSIRISAGSSRACGSRRARDGGRRLASAPDRLRGIVAEPRATEQPAAGEFAAARAGRACPHATQRSLPLLLRRARLGAVRGDHQARGILSDAGRDGAARSLWRGDRRARRPGPRAGRVRLGLEPQDEPAARRAGASASLYPDRHRRGEPRRGRGVAVRPASGSRHRAADRRLHRDARAAGAGAAASRGSASSPARPSAI